MSDFLCGFVGNAILRVVLRYMLRNDTHLTVTVQTILRDPQCVTRQQVGHIVNALRIILDHVYLSHFLGLFSLYRAIASIREMPSMPYVASNRPWAIDEAGNSEQTDFHDNILLISPY